MSAASLLLAAALAAPGRVVVFPPIGPEGGSPGWIGAAVEELLPRALQRAGAAGVPASDRRRAQEALGVPGPKATRATSVRVAESLGATWLVSGSWDLSGAELVLSLHPLDVTAHAARAPLTAKGPLEELGRLVDGLAWDLAREASLPTVLARDELMAVAAAVPFAAVRALGEGLAARDTDARAQGLRRALALDPDYEEAALALARLLADAGRFEEARQTLARVSRAPSFAREALFLEGVCLLGLGRPAEADVLYAGLAAKEPTAAALANRSAARLRLGTGASGASTLLRQALDRAPFAGDLPFGLGWALLVEGDPEAAAFWLRSTVRYAPSDAAGRLALSWALVASGRSEEAEEQWRAAAALDPSLASRRQPDLTRRLERPLASESGLLLDPARAADAREARAHEARGDALLAAGDAAAAAVELERAVGRDPTSAQGHRLLARAALARGDREKGIAELGTALLCRDDPALRRDLAELLRVAGREAEARRVLVGR